MLLSTCTTIQINSRIFQMQECGKERRQRSTTKTEKDEVQKTMVRLGRRPKTKERKKNKTRQGRSCPLSIRGSRYTSAAS